jgi:hypothetical protein
MVPWAGMLFADLSDSEPGLTLTTPPAGWLGLVVGLPAGEVGGGAAGCACDCVGVG